jgi:hypothetical protein
MYAVLPSIDLHPEVADAYAGVAPAPPGSYRSDGAPVLSREEAHALVAEALADWSPAGLPGE